ncbi:MAG: hypothetical protein Q8O56_12800 [Solirubrobacteraceae bacterium]|nr:hypothetical protein [Solirubrobacteraceae bacterium]
MTTGVEIYDRLLDRVEAGLRVVVCPMRAPDGRCTVVGDVQAVPQTVEGLLVCMRPDLAALSHAASVQRLALRRGYRS